MSNGAQIPERVKAVLGLDPLVCIEKRRILAAEAEKLREKLAPYRAKYRGGTASPYDQERKSQLARAVEQLRAEYAERGEKVSESKLDTMAHAHDGYKEYLLRELEHMRVMQTLEAQLRKVEDDIAEWDRLLDLARTMIHYAASEIRHLSG